MELRADRLHRLCADANRLGGNRAEKALCGGVLDSGGYFVKFKFLLPFPYTQLVCPIYFIILPARPMTKIMRQWVISFSS